MNSNKKFRVWCVSAKCWDNQILETRPITRILESTDYIVQQWAILFDKNAVPIFEGDIILTNETSVPAKVLFLSGSFGIHINYKNSKDGPRKDNDIGDFYPLIDFSSFKVLGNIFENPELLQK